MFLLFVTALATWQAVEIWHQGSIFASVRARLELKTGWLIELLLCPFCLSPWVACVLWIWLWLATFTLSVRVEGLVAAPVYALAASRLANLANDLSKKLRPRA